MSLVESYRASELGDFLSEEVSTGTSIMSVAFEGGVILGADSRSTVGVQIANRVTDKITKVSDKIYCLRSGSAADTQAISDIVAYHLDLLSIEMGEAPKVETAANLFKQLCYSYRDSLSAGIIVAGHDDVHGGQVYAIPIGGMIQKQDIAIGGSGSTYVYGYVDSFFKPNMSEEECVKFVTNTLALAMIRDGSSGGVIRLAIITKDGVQRKIISGEDIPQFYEG